MENHPIPQDVTGFKFKLIGSVTVKQFLYLLGFGILATMAFVLQINIFIKVPLMLFFGGIGASLAFLPIEGRPMDIMLVNFAKTIPSENRYIFRKRGANLAAFPLFAQPKQTPPATLVAQHAQKTRDEQEDKRAILISRLRNSSFRPDQSETRVLNNIHTYFNNSSKPVKTPPAVNQKISAVSSLNLPATTSASINSPTSVVPLPTEPVTISAEDKAAEEAKKRQYEAIVREAEEKREREAEQQQQAAQQEAAVQQNLPQVEFGGEDIKHDIPKDSSPLQQMPEKANPSLAAGFPTLPDIPNVVLGIVKDARGKTIPNVLVEVVDSNGIPVRTFKTSALGQFASATPLPNGTYKVSFEDPQKLHEIPGVEINLTGEIFQPLEVTSVDAREKLRRELFGGAPAAA